MEHSPAPLLQAFLEMVAPWRAVFPQTPSYLRALRQALAGLICLGPRTLSRLIWTNGGQQHSWSAEYFLHSRCRGPCVGLAVDDTRGCRLLIESDRQVAPFLHAAFQRAVRTVSKDELAKIGNTFEVTGRLAEFESRLRLAAPAKTAEQIFELMRRPQLARGA